MAEINVSGTTNLEVTPESEQLTVGNISASPEPTPLESTDSYDNISIPGELLGETTEVTAEEQSTQEEITKQAETTESTETAKTEATNEPNQELSNTIDEQTDTVSEYETLNDDVVFESEDGSIYSLTDIESWKQDADNRHEWNKSNTEKAQIVADQRKAVEPLVNLVAKIKESGEFSESLKEAIEDELGKEAGQLFDQSLQMDNKDLPNPFESELQEARDKLASMEAERHIDQSIDQLRSSYKLTDQQAQDVLDFAVKNFEETNRVLTLEEAYKVMNFDKAPASEPKPKPSVPVNVKKNVGIKAENKGKITSYDDIDVASFLNN